MRAVGIFLSVFAISCGLVDGTPEVVEMASETPGAVASTRSPDVTFCQEPFFQGGTRVWGHFSQCNRGIALRFEARSAVFEGGVSANIDIATPKCPYSSQRSVTYQFSPAFFRLSREQQVTEAEEIIRSQADHLDPACLNGASVDELIDNNTRSSIRELSEFWHWSDQEIEAENRRIRSQNADAASPATEQTKGR